MYAIGPLHTMPSLTYKNLSDTKKQQILHIAFKEFTQHDYENASVSSIIKQLGIAKGSFYRYFRNKLDLYTYLVEYATTVRLDKVEHNLKGEAHQDFFDLLEENFFLRIKFEQQYPIYGQFLYNIMRERHSEVLGNIMLKTKKSLMNRVIQMIGQYQKAQNISSSLDIKTVAFLIIQIQFGLHDFITLSHFDVDDPSLTDLSKLPSLPDERIREIARKFVAVIRHGLLPVS